jgi:hypothetical protein
MIRGTVFWSSPWRETSVVGLADTYLRKQKQAIVCFAPDGAVPHRGRGVAAR